MAIVQESAADQAFVDLMEKNALMLQEAVNNMATIADNCIRLCQSHKKRKRADCHADTDALTDFIRSGNRFYQISRQDGAFTTLFDFNKLFLHHMRAVVKQDMVKNVTNYTLIKAEGYFIEKINVCKHCYQKSSKATCGEHYHPSNRSKKVVITGMVIRTRV